MLWQVVKSTEQFTGYSETPSIWKPCLSPSIVLDRYSVNLLILKSSPWTVVSGLTSFHFTYVGL